VEPLVNGTRPSVITVREVSTSFAHATMNDPQPTPPADPAKTHVAAEWQHTSPLVSCRFDPTGRFVFAGAQDNTVQRWDLADGKATLLAGHESWVRAIAFHPSGEWLYTADYAGRMLWWPAASEAPQPVRTIEAHRGWVRALTVSPDGSLIASVGNDNLCRLWSTSDGSHVRDLAGHTCHVYNVAFHPDGTRLATADLKGVVKDWDLATGTEVRTLDASPLHKYDTTFCADIGGARGMAFSPDGKYLACGGITNVSNAFAGVGNPLAVAFDWAEGKPLVQHATQAGVQGTIWNVRYHPDGYLIGAIGGGAGGYLHFWKPDGATEFFQLRLPDTARDFDLHPDNLRLAAAHFDTRLRIYRMADPAA
jgi:WD40 repeat protein